MHGRKDPQLQLDGVAQKREIILAISVLKDGHIKRPFPPTLGEPHGD